jgi:hypothetical protein
MMRPFLLSATAVVALTVAACSGGSKSPVVAGVPTPTTSTTTAQTGLAKALAYAQCVRSHGEPKFPDPVATPSGDYGFRTGGIDPKSSGFQTALKACKALDVWGSSGQTLTPAQQQAWLRWATCIRSHGVPNFADPTFSGTEVHISGNGSSSPLPQSAMDACKSQMPSAGGLGG